VIRVVVSANAQADLLGAFAFYEERREGLGERFRDHVDYAIGRLQRAPERYPVIYRPFADGLFNLFRRADTGAGSRWALQK
jgi:hypothetical protein